MIGPNHPDDGYAQGALFHKDGRQMVPPDRSVVVSFVMMSLERRVCDGHRPILER